MVNIDRILILPIEFEGRIYDEKVWDGVLRKCVMHCCN